MLEDNDIKKIIEAQKEVFATKTDIDAKFKGLDENFATKKDVENLIDIVATKEELNELRDEVGGMKKEMQNLKTEMKSGFASINEKLDDVISLRHRVEFIENTLNIQPAKK